MDPTIKGSKRSRRCLPPRWNRAIARRFKRHPNVLNLRVACVHPAYSARMRVSAQSLSPFFALANSPVADAPVVALLHVGRTIARRFKVPRHPKAFNLRLAWACVRPAYLARMRVSARLPPFFSLALTLAAGAFLSLSSRVQQDAKIALLVIRRSGLHRAVICASSSACCLSNSTCRAISSVYLARPACV